MPFLARARAAWRNLWRRSAVERRLDEELESYLQLLIDEKAASGLAPEAARRAGLLELEGREQIKERVRRVRSGALVDDLLRDLHYAARLLVRRPAFSAAAIVTLSLGIGATTAIFTIINGVLLRPLPFPHPNALFLLAYRAPEARANGPAPARRPAATPSLYDSDFLSLESRTQAFEGLATFDLTPRSLTGAGDAAYVNVSRVTRDFFSVLGVEPARGRGFAAESAQPGGRRLALISDAMWRARFDGDPSVTSRRLVLDGTGFDIVGVMPAGFAFPVGADVWTPDTVTLAPGHAARLPVIARLRPGATFETALGELAMLARAFPETGHLDRSTWRADLVPLEDLLVADVRLPLRVMAVAVVCVLLIACVNVANLLLARATGREREMAVRTAIGADRGRLIRQALAESLLLALVGGSVGVLLAVAAVQGLVAAAPAGVLPRLDMVHLDARVLGFTALISVVTSVFCGLVPAWRAAVTNVQPALTRRARGLAGGRDRFRSTLAMAEIALALMLLGAAGLLLRSFMNLRAVDLGFRADHAAALTVNLPARTFQDAAAMLDVHARLLEGIARIPTVTSAGGINWFPLGTAVSVGGFSIDRDPGHDAPFQVDEPSVSPGYFRAMGITLIRGRDFDNHDTAAARGVAIISESVARQAWPDADPVGRRISFEPAPAASDWLTIVGVVNDVHQDSLIGTTDAAIYTPLAQARHAGSLALLTVVARTSGDPSAVVPAMRAVLRDVAPTVPGDPTTVEAWLSARTAAPGFQARVLGIFAALALVLAVVGVYGVLDCVVSERTREIGIRVALGAQGVDILALILRHTLTIAAVGVSAGTVGAALLTRRLEGLLFGVTPRDPGTFLTVAGILVGSALLAAVVPIRRAGRVEPMVVLKSE